MAAPAPQQHQPLRLQNLPDDVLKMILLKLDFRDKVNAGKVCPKWDQLLKVGTAATRHWVVDYNVDTILARPEYAAAENGYIPENLATDIVCWFVSRAAAIKSMHVSATLNHEQKGHAARDLLERQLPLLADCLSCHTPDLKFTFRRQSFFKYPTFASSEFATLLCPMVSALHLLELFYAKERVRASEFGFICKLSRLEELSICGGLWGLEKFTSDISRLTTLTQLTLDIPEDGEGLPESRNAMQSLSCLQKLNRLKLSMNGIGELPVGVATLANLDELIIYSNVNLSFPPNLQGLRSLAKLSMTAPLQTIPEAFTGLSTLTLLNLRDYEISSHAGWAWWPTSLSRLTQLAELNLIGCNIYDLPPHVSQLMQLTKLDLSFNYLRKLPEELSTLDKLKELRLLVNNLPQPPIIILSHLTGLKDVDLSDQRPRFGSGDPVFKIPSSLLPILHPGMRLLDLRQGHFTEHPFNWDDLSFSRLQHAMAKAALMTPVPTLHFDPYPMIPR